MSSLAKKLGASGVVIACAFAAFVAALMIQSTSAEAAATPAIVINEFIAAPGTQYAEEWIELYNRGTKTVDLGGWALDDIADGGTYPYTIPSGTYISAGGYLVFKESVTMIKLNNDGDTVRLLSPSGRVRDSIAYSYTKKDYAWGRSPDGGDVWCTFSPATPNGKNPTPYFETEYSGGPTAAAIDADGSGFDDYFKVTFDVDVKGKVTMSVKVQARLYDSSGKLVDADSATYSITGTSKDKRSVKLQPEDMYGIDYYRVKLIVNDYADKYEIKKVKFTRPTPFFRSGATTVTVVDTDNDGFHDLIKVSFDVDLDLQGSVKVKVTGTLYNSNGNEVMERSIGYTTQSANNDAKTITLRPPMDRPDTYKIVLIIDEGIDKYVQTNVYFHRNWYPVADAGPDIVRELPKDTKDDEVRVTIEFDASRSYDKDGTIVTYRWDFGDGTTGTGVKVTHTYTKFGNYRVVLTVIDNNGAKDTDVLYVKIYKPWSLPGFELLALLAALCIVVGTCLLGKVRRKKQAREAR